MENKHIIKQLLYQDLEMQGYSTWKNMEQNNNILSALLQKIIEMVLKINTHNIKKDITMKK